MQTDDLAAQMVRAIHDTGCIAIHFSDFAALEAIARRYMEKLFSEDELRRSCELVAEYCGDYLPGQSAVADILVNKIRAERAGKDGR